MSNENVKTFVFPDNTAGSSVDSGLLMAMNNGGFGGGAWNNPIWALAFLAFLGNGGFGFGNGNGNNSCTTNGQLNAIREQLSDNQNSTLLMDAIKGNSSALTTLASNLNLNTNAVTAAVNGVQSQIATIGANQGMNALQVVNAIQSGNQTLASQLSQCCCENKQLVQQMGYEGQIRDITNSNALNSRIDQLATGITQGFSATAYETAQQTNSLQNGMSQQTQTIIDKLSAMEANAQQDKINTLTAQLATANAKAERQAELAPIINQLNAIKAAQPATATVNYPNLVGVPLSQALGYGYNYGYGTNSIWG